MSSSITHFNSAGEAVMVDVHSKSDTLRRAIACGKIFMQPDTLRHIQNADVKKGDVLGVARIAGIQAGKQTWQLIPLCHPILLSHIQIEFLIEQDLQAITCKSVVECTGKTGVEMEALTCVSVALLTIYDMCKSLDRGMIMGDIKLLSKIGGKSEFTGNLRQ